MKIEAHYDTSAHMIIIRVAAEVTSENILLSARRALELSEQHLCNNMLFDIRQCWLGQSMTRGFDIMQNAEASLGLLPKHNIAIVYNPSTYPSERAQFIEDVTSNRPNPKFRMFTDLHAAITWLHNMRPSKS